MLLDLLLVWQESVERAVQPHVVDPLFVDTAKILERGRAVPLLGHVQLADGSDPTDHQNLDQVRPPDSFTTRRQ